MHAYILDVFVGVISLETSLHYAVVALALMVHGQYES